MKQHRLPFLAAALVLAAAFLVGCGVAAPDADDGGDFSVQLSYLTDESSRDELDEIMAAAGISEARRAVFWAHVEQFNGCEGIAPLPEGTVSVDPASPDYDAYAMQDVWSAAHPEFTGYNCRITSFSLLGDAIAVENAAEGDPADLFLDRQALEEDPSAIADEAEQARFFTLFATVAGENTDDPARQAELVLQAWQSRGAHFDGGSASLVTVFLHNQYSETENELIPGHAGVLFDCGEEGLVFVEKLAFQAPYQAVRLKDREELKSYLMHMYDVEWDQPTAPPFILENDQIL